MIALRHRLEYFAVAILVTFLRVLPMKFGSMLGAIVGMTFYVFDGRRRRIAITNLASAFPSRSRRECCDIARSVFRHFGRLLIELLQFGSLSPADMRARVEFEGLERVQQAYASGRGVLIFTGHFGYWEMLAIAHGLEIGPLSLLARPLDNPWLEAMLKRIRTCTGNPIIYRRGAVRRVIRALSANQAVGIPIDQHIHGADAVQVEFFKRPVATTSTVAALALRTGAVVIPVFALGLPDGRYRLIYEHPISPPVDAGPEAVKELTQRCTDVLERYVRQYPELWLWMHRRWRDTTPEVRDHGNAGGINGHRDTI